MVYLCSCRKIILFFHPHKFLNDFPTAQIQQANAKNPEYRGVNSTIFINFALTER